MFLVATSILSGCHLIFPFEAAKATDSSSDAIADGGPDSMTDGQTSDFEVNDDSLQPDALMPDVLKPDNQLPDTLKPDIDLCAGVTCGSFGSCKPTTGKCVCNTGFAGVICNKCAFAYGPAYPTCNAIAPTVAIKINCSSPCNKLSTTTVDITFSNATTFTTQLDCLSGTCVGNSAAVGTANPPNGALPTTTTNTQKLHTIQWTFGGSDPTDLRIRVFVTGPGGTIEDNKSVALSP